MLNRRLLVAGGLALAAAPALVVPTRAQGSRISVTFVGHEL